MADSENIDDTESLARYVLFRSHVRNDQTVRPDAFLPFPRSDLSVTRHANLNTEIIWALGGDVAAARGRPLLGRADILAGTVRSVVLDVIPDPMPHNPNHANIVGWPEEKSDQKTLAIKLADAALYLARTQS